MSDALFAAALALAWFTGTNVAVSLVACTLGRTLKAPRLVSYPEHAARVFLGLRLLPGAASIFVTLALFLPAHLRLEPAGTSETLGGCLAVLAIGGLVLVASTVRRAVRCQLSSRRVVGRWSATASRLRRHPGGLPVFVLSDPAPIVTLVGLLRSRLFLSREVVDALTPEELDVSVAHEEAHEAEWDNVKRLLVAWSPDALAWTAPGRELNASWRAAMEFAADARAARGSRRRAVALASALVKVARLAPRLEPVPNASSALHDAGLLAQRIDRLLDAARLRVPAPVHPAWRLAFAAALVAVLAHPSPAAWLAVHEITEGLVRFLP
jgi:Zn-dependent protease with chaperone function